MCNLYCCIVWYDLYCHDGDTVRAIYIAALYGTIYTVTMVTRYVQSISLHCTVRFILLSRWLDGTSSLYCCIARYDLYYCRDGCTIRPVYTAILYGTIYTALTMTARYVLTKLLHCTIPCICTVVRSIYTAVFVVVLHIFLCYAKRCTYIALMYVLYFSAVLYDKYHLYCSMLRYVRFILLYFALSFIYIILILWHVVSMQLYYTIRSNTAVHLPNYHYSSSQVCIEMNVG